MIHHRERLPLGLKAGDDLLGVHAQLDDLECHAAADGFLLFGDIDHATAALAEILAQFVAADTGARFLGQWYHARRDDECLGGQFGRRPVQEFSRLVMGSEQRLDALAQLGIIPTSFVEVGGTLLDRQLEHGIEDGLLPLWGQVWWFPESTKK